MDATNIDDLAWAVLLDPLDETVPLTDDLRGAFGRDRHRGILPVPAFISQSARTATLQRDTLGDRNSTGIFARAFLLRAAESAFPAYAHVIALDSKRGIAYTSVQGLPKFSDTSKYVQALLQWDIGSAITSLLRWYGFSGNYRSGQETTFEISGALWESWSGAEKSRAVARARRLASDYKAIMFEISHPTRLRIITNGQQRVVYEGFA